MKERLSKLPAYCFYIGLTIELLIVLHDRSILTPLPEGLIYRFTFALFVLAVCFTKYTKKEWLWIIAFAAFALLMYYLTRQNVALRAVFFVAAMRCVNIKAAMKYTFWLSLAGFLLIVALAFMGIGRDISTTQVFREGIIETRYDFGIGHPNTFYCMLLMTLLLFLYCYYEKLRWPAYAVLFAANIGLYLLTDSNTGFAVCTLFIICAALFHLMPRLREKDWPYFVGMGVFLLCIAFSIWAAYWADQTHLWWSDTWPGAVDKILTGRLRGLHFDRPSDSARLSEWTLFATNANYEMRFDMGWVRMFYWFGIIPGSLFCIAHLLLINECRRQRDYMALVMMVIISIYTVVEGQFISLYLGRNYLLFLFGMYWGAMLCADEGEAGYWWSLLSRKSVV